MTGLEEAIRAIVVEEIAAVESRILALLPEQLDRSLTVHEAADYVRISDKLMYQLCQEGIIPHERYGVPGSRKPKIIIRLSDLEAYRAEQRASNYKKGHRKGDESAN
ncbi:helix-turn-helix domain-containing protein [Paenibacillus aceti]|uniref:Helix-turn-helix domain-containing protein n=1 Tax=Paenibacillus aceti TaxID=1820010 RepID=A0ABQ1VPQ1_9BACL|nr:helix-turn-helix domain-containing protein [Paenibacillus aceti]GGF86426.1 hypothetical protein GCM10010913_04900 [Paenibacillus aceti]